MRKRTSKSEIDDFFLFSMKLFFHCSSQFQNWNVILYLKKKKMLTKRNLRRSDSKQQDIIYFSQSESWNVHGVISFYELCYERLQELIKYLEWKCRKKKRSVGKKKRIYRDSKKFKSNGNLSFLLKTSENSNKKATKLK